MNLLQSTTPMPSYLVMIAVIAALDVAVGDQISLWVFFLVPVGLATWNLGLRPGLVLAAFCAALILANGLIVGYPFAGLLFFLLAVASRFLAMMVVVWLIGLLRKREVERVYARGTASSTLPPGVDPKRSGTA